MGSVRWYIFDRVDGCITSKISARVKSERRSYFLTLLTVAFVCTAINNQIGRSLAVEQLNGYIKSLFYLEPAPCLVLVAVKCFYLNVFVREVTARALNQNSKLASRYTFQTGILIITQPYPKFSPHKHSPSSTPETRAKVTARCPRLQRTTH